MSIGILLSKTTILAMYGYIVHKNPKKLREVKFSMVGLVLTTLCHLACLGIDEYDIIFYLWAGSIVLELICDVISRLKYEPVNHDVEHHTAERLGCFTMVVLGASATTSSSPTIAKTCATARIASPFSVTTTPRLLTENVVFAATTGTA